MGGRRWDFRSEGLWRPPMLVIQGSTEVASLRVEHPWTSTRAILRISGGRPIASWVMTSLLRGDVSWQAEDGAPLVVFRRGTDEGGIAGWWRTQCRVDLSPAGFAHPDRDLLLCLGWRFTVLSAHDAF